MDLLIEQKIGQNIKEIRMQAGYTQEMLSAKLQVEGCDITRSALAKIEVGQRHLYVDELIALQKIFRVPYETLLKVK